MLSAIAMPEALTESVATVVTVAALLVGAVCDRRSSSGSQ